MAWQDDGADWWKPKPEGGWQDADEDIHRNADWWKRGGKPKCPVKIPFFAHFYAWVFVVGLMFWPAVIPVWWPGGGDHDSLTVMLLTGGLIVVIQALFWFVRHRCSGEKLSFWDGLLIVSASAMTNWTYTDVLVVLPTLLYAFLASIVFAPAADAPKLFHDFVFGMCQKRMRQ